MFRIVHCRLLVYNGSYNTDDWRIYVMKDRLHKYKDAIIGNGLYDLVKHICGFIFGSALTGIITNILITIFNNEIINQYRIPISILCILLIILVLLEIYTRNFRYYSIIPKIECDYDIIKREVTFTYGRDCSYYSLNLIAKSNIKGLNRIKGKYTWSGSAPAIMECTTKHCKIIPLTRKDSFIEYEVELRKNFRKGARVECQIAGTMPDPEHTFIPFFSTRIHEYTDELIINIHIPPEYNVREIICEEIAITREYNEDSAIKYLNDDGKYTWVIHHPKLFYVYSVRWEL